MLTAQPNCFTTPDKKDAIECYLFCFPFAGSGASYFSSWARHYSDTKVQLCGVQYPGRESRIREPLISDISILVSELSHAISELSAGIPFAFYGHSMGATIAYEIALHLEKNRRPLPEFLCLSGRNPPHHPKQTNDLCHLSDAEFIREIEKLGNLPKQIIEDPELINFLLPIMRNDALLLKNYKPVPGRIVKCPLDVHGGDEDPCADSQCLAEWEAYTTMDFNVKVFEGSHFFINQYQSEICALLKDRIVSAMPHG